MALSIVVSGSGSVSIRIEVRSRKGAAKDAEEVRLLIGDAGDALSVYAAAAPGGVGRGDGARSRRARGAVTPEMEAAAVEALLAAADLARLGRSLADVYEAMEDARLGGGPAGDED